MKDVIAVVVQPGVAFGDEQVFDYNPAAAVDLCAALKEFPDICFEGPYLDMKYKGAQPEQFIAKPSVCLLYTSRCV